MIANQHVVAEIKAALPAVFDVAKYGDLEQQVIEKISESRLLSLARSHEQDSLGVEIMQYVNECFESCIGNNLQISRLNASSLDNIVSVLEDNRAFFKESTAYKYYDYSLTGRINKVDGLFVFNVYSQNRSVYRWLLNLEVDGQDKTKESFSCAMKMWQAVDLNRARTADAITFTLRANIYKMHTHRFNDANKVLRRLFVSKKKPTNQANRQKSKRNTHDKLGGDSDYSTADDGQVDELSPASDDNESEDEEDKASGSALNASFSSPKNKKLINSKDSMQMQLETAIYFLRTYANAHVYFVCEMLRFVCREGKLYNELYASYTPGNISSTSTSKIKRKNTRPIYDVHCFLGAFDIDTPTEIRLQDNQPVPYPALAEDAKTKCRWTTGTSGAPHKYHAVCTIPSFTNQSRENSLWQNWTADVHNIPLALPDDLRDVPLRFLCVQRVKMNSALGIMREESVRAKNKLGWDLFTQPQVSREFNGIWYVQDIVDFLLGTQSFIQSSIFASIGVLGGLLGKKSKIVTWEKFNSIQTYTNIGLTPDTERAQRFVNAIDTSIAGQSVEHNCYSELMKTPNFSQKYNRLVGRSTSKKQTNVSAQNLFENEPFYPESSFALTVPNARTKNGFFYVLQGVADEMLNSLFSLFSHDLEGKSSSMRIRWHDSDVKNHIEVQPILKTLKLIRRDIDVRVTDRKSFNIREYDKWEEQAGLTGNFFPHSQSSLSFNAVLLRSLHKSLPDMERNFAIYVQRQNVPGANLFLRALRLYNYIAARELWTQVQNSESLKAKMEQVISIFPLGVQTELLALLRTLHQDDTLLAIEIQRILRTIPPFTDWNALPRTMKKAMPGLLQDVMQLLENNYTGQMYCSTRELRNTTYYRHLLLLQRQIQRSPATNLQSLIVGKVENETENQQYMYTDILSSNLIKLRSLVKEFLDASQVDDDGGQFLASLSKHAILDWMKNTKTINLHVGDYDDHSGDEAILQRFYTLMLNLNLALDMQFFQKWCMPTFLQRYQRLTLLSCMTSTLWRSEISRGTWGLDIFQRYLVPPVRGTVKHAFKVHIQQLIQDVRSDSLRTEVDWERQHTPAILTVSSSDTETIVEMFSENAVRFPLQVDLDFLTMTKADDVQFFSHALEINSFYSLHQEEEICTLTHWDIFFNSDTLEWNFKQRPQTYGITAALVAPAPAPVAPAASSADVKCIDLACSLESPRTLWALAIAPERTSIMLFKRNEWVSGPYWKKELHSARIVAVMPSEEVLVIVEDKLMWFKLTFIFSNFREEYIPEIEQIRSMQISGTVGILEPFAWLTYDYAAASNTFIANESFFDVARTQRYNSTLNTHTFQITCDKSTTPATWACFCSSEVKPIQRNELLVPIHVNKYWSIDSTKPDLPLLSVKCEFRTGDLCQRALIQLVVDSSDSEQYCIAHNDSSNDYTAYGLRSDTDLSNKNNVREVEHYTTLKRIKFPGPNVWKYMHSIQASKHLHNFSASKHMANMPEFETIVRFYSTNKWQSFMSHASSRLLVKELAQQFAAVSWLHMQNCYQRFDAVKMTKPNMLPVACDGLTKNGWQDELQDLYARENYFTPPLNAEYIDRSKLALMSSNIIVHFTSTKWRDTLITARVLLQWFFFAVLGNEKILSLPVEEQAVRQQQIISFANMHNVSAKSLHKRIALQMYGPVMRGYASAMHTAEQYSGSSGNLPRDRTWNPGVQCSTVDLHVTHPGALSGCSYNSFLHTEVRGSRAEMDYVATIKHDYSYLLIFAQFQRSMSHCMTEKKRIFAEWREVRENAPMNFKDIERSMWALRWNYYMFLRTIQTDFSDKAIQNVLVAREHFLQAWARNKTWTNPADGVDDVDDKVCSWHLQCCMQKNFQHIVHRFADDVAVSVHNAMLIHLKWKRFLIKKVFIARLEYAIRTFKDSRMYFQLESPTMTEEYLQEFMSRDMGRLREFELLSEVRTNTGQFATALQSFPDYEAMTRDRNANNEEIKIVMQGQMPGVFALLDFLLHRHNMAEKRQQKTVLSDSHEQIWIYLRDVVTFDTVQQGQM